MNSTQIENLKGKYSYINHKHFRKIVEYKNYTVFRCFPSYEVILFNGNDVVGMMDSSEFGYILDKSNGILYIPKHSQDDSGRDGFYVKDEYSKVFPDPALRENEFELVVPAGHKAMTNSVRCNRCDDTLEVKRENVADKHAIHYDSCYCGNVGISFKQLMPNTYIVNYDINILVRHCNSKEDYTELSEIVQI